MPLREVRIRGAAAVVDEAADGTRYCARTSCPHYQLQRGLAFAGAGAEERICALAQLTPERTCIADAMEGALALSDAQKRAPRPAAPPPRPLLVSLALRRGGALRVRLNSADERQCAVAELDGHPLLSALCHVAGDELVDAGTGARIFTITEREAGL
jgi:hypothetical protein